jgi:GTPase SAR1 family protein
MPPDSSHRIASSHIAFKSRTLLPAGRSTFGRMAWSPDGQLIAVPGSDRRVRVLHAYQGTELYSVPAGDTGVLCTSWGNSSLLAGDYDGWVYSWSADSLKYRVALSSSPIRSIAAAPGQTTAAVCDGGSVVLIDVRTGGLIRRLQISALGAAWIDGDRLAIAAANGHSAILSRDGQVLQVLQREEAPRSRYSYEPTWSRVRVPRLLLGEDHDIETQFPSPYPHLSPYRPHSRTPPAHTAIAWSPSVGLLATGSSDGTVAVWEDGRLTAKPVRVLEGHTDAVVSLSFSRDGSVLASKSLDHSVNLRRTDDWDILTSIRIPVSRSGLTSICFSPNHHSFAITGGLDRSLEVVEYSPEVVADAQRSARSVHYTTAKIVLVGDSGVGKTGLGWRLAYDVYKEQSSTHGQQFWLLQQLSLRRKDGTDCEAVLWDLAGQPDYRLVHALFLGDADLAILVFDPTTAQDGLSGVKYWLNVLGAGHPRLSTVLIGARIDRGAATFTDQELEQFCRQYGIDGGYLATSALTGENIDALLDRLTTGIDWNAKTATVTTEAFKSMKDFVLSIKADPASVRATISIRELLHELRTSFSRTIKEEDITTAVQHLAKHGYITILPETEQGAQVLLTPDLLTNLVSSLVLEARRNPKGLGALEEDRVLSNDYEFAELDTTTEHERRQLLDSVVVILLERSLCFREVLGEHRLLVFPSLINQKWSQSASQELIEETAYVLSGAVETVYSALVVLLGYTNTFARSNHWQDHAEYEFGAGEVCVLRQNVIREGAVEIVLLRAPQVADSTFRLFEGLVDHFLRGRELTIERLPSLVCSCGYRQSRASILDRLAGGKTFTFCTDCGYRLDLSTYGGRQGGRDDALKSAVEEEAGVSSARREFEAALVHVKRYAKGRGKMPSCFLSYSWEDDEHRRWVTRLATDMAKADVDVIYDQWDNLEIGSNLASFVDRVFACDFVALIGTPGYLQKYRGEAGGYGKYVKAEVDLVNTRLINDPGATGGVLPVLRAGSEAESFPPRAQGRVYADFTTDSGYFASLFAIILTVHRIPQGRPPFSDIIARLSVTGLAPPDAQMDSVWTR